ncbi:MAG: transketolase, partial [Chlamydiales bacterium]|nr:transketolase [Chlamydiales bacterium]
LAALNYSGPTALILARQELPCCPGTARLFADGVGRGAYVLKRGAGKLDFTLISTGSEVHLALKTSEILENRGYKIKVVSMPSWELFEKQSDDYKHLVLGNDSGLRVSIEAAAEIGWHKYVLNGKVVSLKTFGKSATSTALAQEFGFTVEAIVDQILHAHSKL